ncbi:MAG: hypothetical protein ABIP48_00555 [Planctomycetota bacterium]
MTSDDHIEREIVEILQVLAKRQTWGYLMAGLVFFFVAGGALALVGLLGLRFSAFEYEGAWAVIGGGSVLALCIAAFVNTVNEYSACKAAKKWYYEKFPLNSTERRTADRVLAGIEEPEQAANSLREKLRIKRLKQVKQVKQEEEEAREAKARNPFEITSSFKCSACGASVDVVRLGQTVHCGKCNKRLQMPWRVACPVCVRSDVRIISPEEQVKPRTQGKWAGTLMAGPAGFIAGAVLDGAKDAVFGGIERSLKKPKCECKACGHTWAIKLPPLGN